MSPTYRQANRFGASSPTFSDAYGAPKPLREDARVYQQQSNRVGLLVTQEMNKAISKCKKRVENIAKECRRKNRKFRDLEFDLDKDRERCLLGLATSHPEKFRPSDVLRVSQIFDDPQFIIDGARSSDIEQGNLSDCWFLCAVATLSTMPGLIDRMCVARDEKVGIYGFVFFRDGDWADVIIDDQLYTDVPNYDTLASPGKALYHNDKELYNKIARKGRKTLYFARSSKENETWVSLLEKAYAKFHGDYAALSHGEASEAMEDLTGGVSQVVYTMDILDKDQFWNEELLQAAKDRIFGCFIESFDGQGVTNKDIMTNGLIAWHSYSILGAVEYRGKRFLKVRNPWGKSEWSGRWSDGSKEWTKEWLDALDVLDHKFGDDGEFIMEYEDFLDTWHGIDKTQLFDSSWIYSAHWLNVTSRRFPCAWRFGDVSFTFSLPKASQTTIVLAQLDRRFWLGLYGNSYWSFDFVLYEKGSEEVLGRSDFSSLWPRSVTLNTELQAGDYVLHVRLDRDQARSKDYIYDNMNMWNPRKLSRVWSENARSMSIASNFEAAEYSLQMMIPAEAFAGRDLTQLEIESYEVASREQKAQKDRFLPRHKSTISSYIDQERTYGQNSYNENASVIQGPTVGEPDTESRQAMGVPNPECHSPKLEANIAQETRVVTNSAASKPQEGEDETSSSWSYSPPKPATDIGTGTDVQSEPGHVRPPGTLELLCDGCHRVILGARWRCLDVGCGKYELCDNCHEFRVSSLSHNTAHKMHRLERPADPSDVHYFLSCDGCKMDPIVGVRWMCLVCRSYDLCDSCHASGGHPVEHRMLRIESPERPGGARTRDFNFGTDDNDVVLGLRIYTKKESVVNICGQLRHGDVFSWKN